MIKEPCFDGFLKRTYDAQHYNCLDFLRDVWLTVTGEDLAFALPTEFRGLGKRRLDKVDIRRFRKLRRPETPCIVVLTRPRQDPHVGMYWGGRMLHLGTGGVEFLPLSLAVRGFKKIRFYR